jgi:restriction system protein
MLMKRNSTGHTDSKFTLELLQCLNSGNYRGLQCSRRLTLRRRSVSRRKKSTSDDFSTVFMILLIGSILFGLNQNLLVQISIAVVFLGTLALFVFWKVRLRRQQWERIRALKLDDVDSMSGLQFERYVARVLDHQGFKTTVTKSSGDLGVDIIAHKDGVSYAIQCKRHSSNVSRTAISDVVAGKQHYRCTQAMVVTNRYFTLGALELAKSTQCMLVDRTHLAVWVQNFQRQRAVQYSVTANEPQAMR